MGVTNNSVQDTIYITGMTCFGCARTIENEMRKFSGIAYEVDFPGRSVTVTYSPSAYARADFEKAIESHGYTITGKTY
jgi:copper chaperone CopZ